MTADEEAIETSSGYEGSPPLSSSAGMTADEEAIETQPLYPGKFPPIWKYRDDR